MGRGYLWGEPLDGRVARRWWRSDDDRKVEGVLRERKIRGQMGPKRQRGPGGQKALTWRTQCYLVGHGRGNTRWLPTPQTLKSISQPAWLAFPPLPPHSTGPLWEGPQQWRGSWRQNRARTLEALGVKCMGNSSHFLYWSSNPWGSALPCQSSELVCLSWYLNFSPP